MENFHECEICHKEFPKEGLLNTHLKSHKREYACDKCPRKFARKPDLNRHKLTHQSMVPKLYCNWSGCSFTVTRKDNLKRHMRLAHCIENKGKEIQDTSQGLYDQSLNEWKHSMKLLSLELHGYGSSIGILPGDKRDFKTELDAHARALHVTAMKGHGDLAHFLASKDANLMAKDNSGRSVVHNAVIFEQEQAVKLLLMHSNITPDSKDKYGRTPLSYAAGRGNMDAVRLLQARNDVDVDSKDNDSRSPLSFATGGGHEAVVKQLLDHGGVEADSRDKNNRTPLSWAAMGGYQSIVDLLLARNDVDPDSKDDKNQTPLSWAAQGSKHKVSGLEVYRSGQRQKVEGKWTAEGKWATGEKHEAVVKLLLTRFDVCVDLKNDDGRTPLSFASGGGHDEVAEQLLGRSEVEADSKDCDGRTPLSWAAGEGHEKVVRLLLARGKANVNSRDHLGWTPIWWAVKGVGWSPGGCTNSTGHH
ncbi:ankyrin repeat-containing domain protein [Leptodontidium sp. MPI-SDFR-AT-0119]|nr:ankyrin repeat-containing domain protein [Leptodontidium sp. MPI-SDFR-AT-0119]